MRPNPLFRPAAILCLIPAIALADATTRPAAPTAADKLLHTTMDRANQVLTEPLAPGATSAQSKVVLAERSDQARRLAASLVGQRVTLHIPVADVVEFPPLDPSPDKSLGRTHKLAVQGTAVLPLPPQVEKDWKQRSLDVAAEYNKTIADYRQQARATKSASFRSYQAENAAKTEAKRNAHLRQIQAAQTLWTPRATLVVIGDDTDFARRRGGDPLRGEAEILSVDYVPWSPVSAGLRYEDWSKAGRMVVTLQLAETSAGMKSLK